MQWQKWQNLWCFSLKPRWAHIETTLLFPLRVYIRTTSPSGCQSRPGRILVVVVGELAMIFWALFGAGSNSSVLTVWLRVSNMTLDAQQESLVLDHKEYFWVSRIPGNTGLLVTWMTSNCLAKSLKPWLVYYVALSEMRVCGVHWTVKYLFHYVITAGEVMSRRRSISNHLEYESTSTWYCLLCQLKMSAATVDHQRSGTGRSWGGYWLLMRSGAVALCTWEKLLLFDIVSQKRMLPALCLFASAPCWPCGTMLIYFLCRDWVMTVLWHFMTSPSSTVHLSL